MSSDAPETRKRILRSALDLLVEMPEKPVRMSDIAKRAGITRQAVYLHFATRTELLIAATRYLDEMNDSDALLAESRQAPTGIARLDAFIDAWGSYIPKIHGIAAALMAAADRDPDAAKAWDDRLAAIRHGCQAAVDALHRDGMLADKFTTDDATDLLWTILSVRNWEHLVLDCGWPQKKYIQHIKALARHIVRAGIN